MKTFANLLLLTVALEHFYILYVEMFAWTTLGRKIFRGAVSLPIKACITDLSRLDLFGRFSSLTQNGRSMSKYFSLRA